MTCANIKPAVNNSVLVLYRVFSIVSLYAVLAGVLVFAGVSAFYAVSTKWVAPLILSQSDKDSLDLTEKSVTTQNTIDDLSLDVGKLEATVSEAQAHRIALEKLRPAVDSAIARENQHKRETGPLLANLDEQKRIDDTRTQEVLKKAAEVDVAIDRDLEAGLISKTDAVQAKMLFVKSNGDLTDSKIAATLLKDTILEKTVPTTTYLETLEKKAELESEIATLQITIDTAQKQIATEKSQIATLSQALNTAKKSPLWAAMHGRADVALVPYDNQATAQEGAPVYDCLLSFIVCRQVGTLKATFVGEQHAIHPIFRTDLRGFLVQLNLTDPEAAKSKTLFLGEKPLLF